jgi:hypothetical protein
MRDRKIIELSEQMLETARNSEQKPQDWTRNGWKLA